jgi:hypothetical protein
MEQTFSQRVSILMEKEGFGDNPKAFADFLGMKRPDVLYNVLNNETGFSRSLFEYISKKLSINPEWLERGIGEMNISNGETELEKLRKENQALKRENELLKTIEALRKKIGD